MAALGMRESSFVPCVVGLITDPVDNYGDHHLNASPAFTTRIFTVPRCCKTSSLSLTEHRRFDCADGVRESYWEDKKVRIFASGPRPISAEGLLNR